MNAPEPRNMDNDATALVHIEDPSNVVYWAGQLAVTVTMLRLLVSIHGVRVRDLVAAIASAAVPPAGIPARR